MVLRFFGYAFLVYKRKQTNQQSIKEEHKWKTKNEQKKSTHKINYVYMFGLLIYDRLVQSSKHLQSKNKITTKNKCSQQAMIDLIFKNKL